LSFQVIKDKENTEVLEEASESNDCDSNDSKNLRGNQEVEKPEHLTKKLGWGCDIWRASKCDRRLVTYVP
jgi:hypothetical protein